MRHKLALLILLSAIQAAVAQTAGSPGAIQVATLTLSSAQLQHLANSPVQLVAAPGKGQMILVATSMAQYNAGSSPYGVQSSGRLNLNLGNIGNSVGAVSALSFLDQTTNQVRVLGSPSSGDAQSAYENQPVMVANDGPSEWSSGDGTVTVTVCYTVVALQ